MKIAILSLLILSTQTAFLQSTEITTLTIFTKETTSVGRYEECVALLTKILLEADELAQAIINKQYQKIAPLAIKISKDIYDDINCWKNGVAELMEVKLTELFTNPTECIIKHIRAAAEAIQNAVHAIQEKKWSEAGRFFLIALAEIQQAQQCTR